MKKSGFLSDTKEVHLSIEKDIYVGLKMLLFESDLSLQETFRSFAAMCSKRSPDAIKIIEQIKVAKQSKRINDLLGRTDLEKNNEISAIYDFLEAESKSAEGTEE
mgnify:CR=1 FL=1